ncbi:hypothetical protein AMS68_003811 [Peltaster fructicola]|uniref:Large ribosomal subunit protein bL17m n=1 Tax=Peltaster fructicola TaxID=286661 RepID=A0A6H0XU85_9PEZI|nr:hypothetical protein AMS68_003811 [Peltaster fructicola]
MAGGDIKFRHLGRTSAHRQALLRNLVTSLIQHESISTTWAKAKEAQRQAEKLISLGKRNTVASKASANGMVFCNGEIIPKVFGPLAARYAQRNGGFTRVLRTEPLKEDQAPSAILELVDGPKDMRFALTARTIARAQANGHAINDMTAANIAKVTRYRKNGERELQEMVKKFASLHAAGEHGVKEIKKQRVGEPLPVSR